MPRKLPWQSNDESTGPGEEAQASKALEPTTPATSNSPRTSFMTPSTRRRPMLDGKQRAAQHTWDPSMTLPTPPSIFQPSLLNTQANAVQVGCEDSSVSEAEEEGEGGGEDDDVERGKGEKEKGEDAEFSFDEEYNLVRKKKGRILGEKSSMTSTPLDDSQRKRRGPGNLPAESARKRHQGLSSNQRPNANTISSTPPAASSALSAASPAHGSSLSAVPANPDWATFHRYRLNVMGRNYAPRSQTTVREPLTFRREPTNQHDSHAIAVYNASNMFLGYMPAADAQRLARSMDSGHVRLRGQTVGKGKQSEWLTKDKRIEIEIQTWDFTTDTKKLIPPQFDYRSRYRNSDSPEPERTPSPRAEEEEEAEGHEI